MHRIDHITGMITPHHWDDHFKDYIKRGSHLQRTLADGLNVPDLLDLSSKLPQRVLESALDVLMGTPA